MIISPMQDSARPARGRYARLLGALALLVASLLTLTSCAEPESPPVTPAAVPGAALQDTPLPRPTLAPPALPTQRPSPTPAMMVGTTPVPTDEVPSPEPLRILSPVPLPPTTPDAVLARALPQALRTLKGQQILFSAQGHRLMLADLASGQQVWLTAAIDDGPCNHTGLADDPIGLWSPDGRFLAITCVVSTGPSDSQDWSHGPAATFVLDLQSGSFQQLEGSGDPTQESVRAWIWAPTGHRLLANQLLEIATADPSVSAHFLRSWFIVDVATGAHTAPITLGDESWGGWSPDGAELALAGPMPGTQAQYSAYLLDADGSGQRRLEAFKASALRIGYEGWSPDGAFVYFRLSSISPHDRGLRAQVQASTGKLVDVTYAAPAIEPASPDRKWYLTRQFDEPDRNTWSLYRADGTLVREKLADPEKIHGASWMPDSRRILIWTCSTAQVTGVHDGQVAIVDLNGDQQVVANNVECMDAISSSPDGRLLATDYFDRVEILDLRGRVQSVLQGRRNAFILQGMGGWRPGR